MPINFKVTREEAVLIGKIIARAKTMTRQTFDALTAHMDLSACHTGDCPLDLQTMLDGDNLDFAHDFWGIARHMNRQTGKLEDFFVPRFAKSNAELFPQLNPEVSRENEQALLTRTDKKVSK